MKIEILEGGKKPQRMTEGAAGYDCFARREVILSKGDAPILVPLGFKIAVPKNYTALLFIRSGMSKFGLSLTNAVGVIDSDYRGEVCALMQYSGGACFAINAGERVCQLLITPIFTPQLIEVEKLEATERGEGGFGSTGK